MAIGQIFPVKSTAKIQSDGMYENCAEARLREVEAKFGQLSLREYLTVFCKWYSSNGHNGNGAKK